MRALQAQIEPHFLFNTLANVTSLIEPDPARAKHMLETFIRFLRASLAATRRSSTTLADEFALIGDFLEVLEVRMGERLQVAIDLPADLGAIEIPAMLLQPVVENAIRHGLEPKVEGGRIELRARREGGTLVLEVADTGVGFGEATAGGVGLANIRERLRLAHGDAARLSIRANAPQGTIVAIELPVAAPMKTASPKVLVADDEPALAQFLHGRLAALWPEATLLPAARNGLEALAAIREDEPDAAFLDIRMPGLTGLELAARIESPHPRRLRDGLRRVRRRGLRPGRGRLPREAGGRRATVARHRAPQGEDRRARGAPGAGRGARAHRRLAARAQAPATFAGCARSRARRSTRSRSRTSSTSRRRTSTPAWSPGMASSCIRTALSDLAKQLDPATFAQVHRSTLLNLNFVASTRRDLGGRVFVRLKDARRTELPVSRACAHLFRQM